MHLRSILVPFLLSSPALAQCEVAGFSGLPGSNFGADVSVSGDWAFVGAPRISLSSPPEEVRIYHRVGGSWTHHDTLPSPASNDAAHYGRYVDVDGNILFVSAHMAENDGRVYVYERNGMSWDLVQTIAPGGVIGGASFGQVLDFEGDVAVIGRRFVMSANVYERIGGTWTLVDVLSKFGGGSGAGYGAAVAVAGDRVVVGAPEHTESGGLPFGGGAFVYRKTTGGWIPESILVDPGPDPGIQLGGSLAGDPGRIVMGSQALNGEVLSFVSNGSQWLHEQTLVAEVSGHWPPTTAAYFGTALDLAGDTLVITDPTAYGSSHGTGAAWYFEHDGSQWQHRSRFFQYGGYLNNNFGARIATDGESIWTGSSKLPDRAVVHDLSMGVNYTFCESAPNSLYPEGARMGWVGDLSLAHNDLAIRVRNATTFQYGLYFYGTSTTQVPFGDGFLCVASPIRLGSPVVLSVSGPLPIDLNNMPAAGGGTLQVSPGTLLHFQAWYRDPALGGAGFNLSNGLSLEICP